MIGAASVAAVAAVTIAAAPGFTEAIVGRTERIVVAIGINTFEHAAPQGDVTNQRGWLRLGYAEKDAQDVVDVLRPYGFEPFRGRVYTGADATLDGILRVLDELVETTARSRHNTFELVVYVSSHGFSFAHGDRNVSFIVTRDTPGIDALTRGATSPADAIGLAGQRALRRDDLQVRFVERLRAANVTRVAIIVDACDAPAGKLTSQSKGTPVDAEATRTDRRWSTERFARLERSALILESASSQQPAQEVAAFENSVYTYFLKRALGPDVEAVRRASCPGLPGSLFGAHVWASLRVSEYTGGAQTPSWSGPDANVGSGLFLLEDHRAPSRTSDATLIRLGEPSAPGLRMRVRALVSAMMKGTSTTTTSGWEAIVETAGVHVPAPGRYEVSFESPDGELASSREVDLEMGTTNTIYPFVELAGRGTERISVDVGASIPLAEWGRPGATLGAGARVSHGVDDTPIDGLVGDLSLELSVGARRHPEAPDLQQRDVLLLMGAGLAVDGQLGAARLGLGPELLVGGLRRELDALGRADYHAVVGIGLRPWAWFRVSTHFGLELAVHARALALGSVETGALFLGATAGVALDRPTTRVRPEAR